MPQPKPHVECVSGRACIVSIHDVSPPTRRATEAMLADLARAGVGRTSLLVVPDHHRRAPVAKDPDFQEWLRHRAAEGHEIVLHGFYHWRDGGGGGWAAHWITEHYTAGEGEFYDLDYGEARRRLARGRQILADAGLPVVGFIAPAWLLGSEAERAAREEGFEYTTRLRTVLDLRTGGAEVSQSLVYSVRAAWRRVVSLGWNALLRRRLRARRLLRLGLHPPDLRHGAVWAQAMRLAREEAAGREVTTYGAWVLGQRAAHSLSRDSC